MIGRSLLFVIWAYVLWGTLYGAALAYALVAEGPGALRRAVSGADPLAGTLSVVAAGVAIVVWSTIGTLALLTRGKGASGSAP